MLTKTHTPIYLIEAMYLAILLKVINLRHLVISFLIDQSQIRLDEHETMASFRGWSFRQKKKVEPRNEAVVLYSIKRMRDWSIGRIFKFFKVIVIEAFYAFLFHFISFFLLNVFLAIFLIEDIQDFVKYFIFFVFVDFNVCSVLTHLNVFSTKQDS